MVMNYKDAYCGGSNGPPLHGVRKVFQKTDILVDAMKAVPENSPDDRSHCGQDMI